jgi:hypothetical protein
MVERRTEFPALEARRWFLEHEYHYAQRQADDAVRDGKADGATQQWIVNVRAELDELNYVLRTINSHQDHRIEITQQTLLVSAMLYGVVMAVIVILFMHYYGA